MYLSSVLIVNAGFLLPSIHKEIDYALSSQLPSCKGTLNRIRIPYIHFSSQRNLIITEWTPITIWPQLFHTMALVVSLIAVGPELNRDDFWLTTMITFLDDLFVSEWELKSYQPFLRPIVARGLVPGIRRVWKHQANARELLLPIIKKRRVAEAAAHTLGQKYEKPHDILQWLMDNGAKTNPPRTDANVAELCLTVGFGAIHASTITLTNVVFDLAAMPEYNDPIREEWEAAKEKFKYQDNPAGMMNSLDKLDSFMKESQRLNPVALSKFFLFPFSISFTLLSFSSENNQANNMNEKLHSRA
jgi:hypothetical protein